MGERTPHLDAQARGGWIGLTARHTRADLIRVGDRRRIVQPAGLPGDRRAVGRGGRRRCGLRAAARRVRSGGRLLADIFGKRVVTLATQEGSAYGAALLAMVGTGEYASVPEACAATIREAESVDPRAAEAALYARGHEVYRALYPALRPVFERMGRMT